MKGFTGFQGEPGTGKTIRVEGLTGELVPEFVPMSDSHIGAPESSITEFIKRILDSLPETMVIVFIGDEFEPKN